MSTEENKAVVRRIYEAMNKGQEATIAALDELYAPDYVWHGPFGDMDVAASKQITHAWYAAFPDAHVALEDLIAEGDKVVQRYTVRATHRGDFMGVAATGRVVTFTGIIISRFAGGKCMEDWDKMDALGFQQQLGVVPQMAQAGA